MEQLGTPFPIIFDILTKGKSYKYSATPAINNLFTHELQFLMSFQYNGINTALLVLDFNLVAAILLVIGKKILRAIRNSYDQIS